MFSSMDDARGAVSRRRAWQDPDRGSGDSATPLGRQPLKPRPGFPDIRFQLGVGTPPDINYELIGVSRLLSLTQTLRDPAPLQHADDEKWAPDTPDPLI